MWVPEWVWRLMISEEDESPFLMDRNGTLVGAGVPGYRGDPALRG